MQDIIITFIDRTTMTFETSWTVEQLLELDWDKPVYVGDNHIVNLAHVAYLRVRKEEKDEE